MNSFQKWVKAQGGPTPAAKLLGITRVTVNNWLKGKHQPGYCTAVGVVTISRRRGPRVSLFDLWKGGK